MSVPEEILKIKRPAGTIVMDSGHQGSKQWAVRARKGYESQTGEKVKLNQIVGHIYNGQFIPKKVKIKDKTKAECLSYGACAYAQKFTQDLFQNLSKVFDLNDAISILAIAILKVIKPGISNSRLQAAYNRTFLTKSLAGAHLSKDTVGNLIEMIGRTDSARTEFTMLRLEKTVEEHHIAIDGTLIQDTSSVNDLSEWSFKSRERKHKEISIIYAYDIELREPICSAVYPGNCTDATVYANFIETNGINKGMLIADKGFPPKKIRSIIEKYPNLKYLTPVRRNDIRIEKYELLNFTNALLNTDDRIFYSKMKITDNIYLYTFKDIKKSYEETTSYFNETRRKNEGVVDGNALNKKEQRFGTITFESNCDLDPEIAYSAYQNRWLIEVVFNQYKSELNLDKTNVQSDFRVIGENFINQLAATIASRMITDLQKKEILKKYRFSEVIDDLSGLWRKTESPLPKRDDKYWRTNVEHVFELAEILDICEARPKQAPKPRGRPKKEKEVTGEKRPRGRPKKLTDKPTVKRPRGRPPKEKTMIGNKHKRGRPPKIREKS